MTPYLPPDLVTRLVQRASYPELRDDSRHRAIPAVPVRRRLRASPFAAVRAKLATGGLIGVTGASATATASADVDTQIGNSSVTTGSGSVHLRSSASNEAVAEADGDVIGLAGFGGSTATATMNGVTRAHTEGATLDAGLDVNVDVAYPQRINGFHGRTCRSATGKYRSALLEERTDPFRFVLTGKTKLE